MGFCHSTDVLINDIQCLQCYYITVAAILGSILMIFSVQDVLQSIHELRFKPHTLNSYATLFIAQQQELFDSLQSGLQQVLIKLYCVRYTLHLKHPFWTIVQKGCFK